MPDQALEICLTKQAKDLTLAYLKRFLQEQPDTLIGLRNRAMLALDYELLTRRSELVALRTEDLEFRSDDTIKLITRSSKQIHLAMDALLSPQSQRPTL